MAAADFGIRGMGLAGVLLAHALKQAGATVRCADTPRPGAASAMAPGIVNPLAGRKYKLNADFARTHAETLATYADLEKALGARFWHPLPLIRLLETPDQAHWLEERTTDPTSGRWIGQRFPAGHHGPAIHDPHGSFETLHAGWLDVPALVGRAQEKWADERCDPDDLAAQAGHLIDCRGWRCAEDPRWADLPWKCARGEVVELALDAPLPRHLWNGGGWLQPLPGGTWRAGATYAWSQFEAPPQVTAQLALRGRLRRWLRAPTEVVDQACGVRAVVLDYRPVLGARPDAPGHSIFTGLGSHGAIQGPACAAVLAQHLVSGQPLPPDVAVGRFPRA